MERVGAGVVGRQSEGIQEALKGIMKGVVVWVLWVRRGEYERVRAGGRKVWGGAGVRGGRAGGVGGGRVLVIPSVDAETCQLDTV